MPENDLNQDNSQEMLFGVEKSKAIQLLVLGVLFYLLFVGKDSLFGMAKEYITVQD